MNVTTRLPRPATRHWLCTQLSRDRRLERRAGSLLLLIAALLACWTAWLGSCLPPDPLHQQWSLASAGLLDNYSMTWVGLDCLEVLGFALTGLLFRRGSPAARTCALLSMPLFFLDAWFDILTSVSRADLVIALLMAGLGELPAVAGLAWTAWKARAFELRH